ncbi:P-loop containing nucleoside triphosphate hydrolase [Pseudocohnilembus persalinus]|uniref:p-loop containing nucleoside triphosphate hydrolase n=1 Tax=Pseudocohnilembus persalinus TaxID=266149 RepID=A0A0V0QSP7_PSEPJ|nr:P-loop containing nucleoside triphosphate hydrolase [Pseudocohnilembus persalinus]|eukprot:KRX05227.1 P-loop containing nucleoside triphosphate hydrolase [Pseudocohnilembus persalinus]
MNNYDDQLPKKGNYINVPQEMNDDDVHRKDMYSYGSMGFEKKYREVQPKFPMKAQDDDLTASQQQKEKQKQIGSLNSKAYLVQPARNLAYYVPKGEIDFLEDDGINNGKPIQLIKLNQEQQWELTEEGIQELSKYQGNVSFVSILGTKQSGKSFLMNQLLKLRESQFESGNDYESYTKGVVMWSAEFPSNPNDARDNNNSILFVILQLISSTVLVNSFGDLSKDSLVPLQDLALLQKFLSLESAEEKEELINLFPKLIYVLRDNQHQVKQNGQNIPINTYLENFLSSDENFRQSSEIEQKIIRRIVKYYKYREGLSMVAPTEPNDPSELNDNFIEELKVLRRKIISVTNKKEFRGVFMNIQMMINFIQFILDSFNQQIKVSLSQAFEVVIKNHFDAVHDDIISLYDEKINQFIGSSSKDDFKSQYEITKFLREIKEDAIKQFYQLKNYDTSENQVLFTDCYNHLEWVLQDKEQLLLKINTQKQQELMERQVDQQYQITKKQVGNGKFQVEDLKNISEQYQHLIQDLLLQYSGRPEQNNEVDPILPTVQKVIQNVSQLFIQEIQESQKLTEQEKNKLNNLKDQLNQHQSSNEKTIQELKNNHKKQVKDFENDKKNQDGKIKNLEKKLDEKQNEVIQLQKSIDQLQKDLQASRKKEKKCF